MLHDNDLGSCLELLHQLGPGSLVCCGCRTRAARGSFGGLICLRMARGSRIQASSPMPGHPAARAHLNPKT